MIQQAILQVLTPIYDPIFSKSSYGFRPRRSAHMALEKPLEYMNQSRDWIVDIDLEKFFDKVHHDKLIQIVSDTLKQLKEKIKFITSRSNGWSFDRRLILLRYLIRVWFNYFKIGTIKTISKEIDKYTRFRLRICIWKQWKKISTKFKSLLKLGIPKPKAWE